MRDKNSNALATVSSISNNAMQAITLKNCTNRYISNQLIKYVGYENNIYHLPYHLAGHNKP